MPHHFRPYPPEQPLLLPPDLRDWLPEDHLVYTVSELVDALDLAAFYAPYTQQGSGNLPYAPAMMVKILVYGYATGVLSSRRLAQKLEEDVAFRVLAAGNRPPHRTLCEFRRRHRADFGAVLVAVVQLARDLGLVSLTTLVPDSTVIPAKNPTHQLLHVREFSPIRRMMSCVIRSWACTPGESGLSLICCSIFLLPWIFPVLV